MYRGKSQYHPKLEKCMTEYGVIVETAMGSAVILLVIVSMMRF